MKIIWTQHAEDRRKQWQKKLGITRQEVETILMQPEQVVPGDQEILMAQTRRAAGLIRVAYWQLGDDKKVITLYWTSRVEKYWRAS